MADKPRRICAICNGLADPLKSPSRTCTFCDFGCSASQGVDISRRTPETGARVGLGHACPLTNTPLPTWITMPNLIAVDQMVRSYVWRSARKVSFSRHAFQGHSRSFKVIRSDTYRSVPMISSNAHSNHEHILYRFQDKARYSPKIANVSHSTLIFIF